MKFEDHISTYWNRSTVYDPADASCGINRVCVEFVKRLALGLSIVKFGRYLDRTVRRAVKAAAQERRYHRKLHMLRQTDWRLRVIQDLGGMDKLHRLLNRQREKIEPEKLNKPEKAILSEDEISRRAHARDCAKACAHPHIMRDPFCVDKDAEFRLPPMPKHWPVHPPWRDYYYEYSYDARPITKLTGFNTPIMVWPEEFFLFMDFEEGKLDESTEARSRILSKRRYAFVQKWLAALLSESEDNPVKAPAPKIKPARAPPVFMKDLNK